MEDYIQQICQGRPYNPEKVEGYTEAEIEKLERLYEVQIKGQLRQFMLAMGRCDGGLLGDDPLIFYRPTMSIKNFIGLQLAIEDSIYDAGAVELSAQKPFVISIQSENHVFFVATRSREPDEVYHLDENANEVKSTNRLFHDYLRDLVRHYGSPEVVCRGEMLIF